MNKIGVWLERNIDNFYLPDPNKSAEDNIFEKRKTYERLWIHAENVISKRQLRFTNHNKVNLKKKLDNNIDYFQKSTYVDNNIEKDIQFFKNNYNEKR